MKQYTPHAGVRYQSKLPVAKPSPMHTSYCIPYATNKLFLHILGDFYKLNDMELIKEVK